MIAGEIKERTREKQDRGLYVGTRETEAGGACFALLPLNRTQGQQCGVSGAGHDSFAQRACFALAFSFKKSNVTGTHLNQVTTLGALVQCLHGKHPPPPRSILDKEHAGTGVSCACNSAHGPGGKPGHATLKVPAGMSHCCQNPTRRRRRRRRSRLPTGRDRRGCGSTPSGFRNGSFRVRNCGRYNGKMRDLRAPYPPARGASVGARRFHRVSNDRSPSLPPCVNGTTTNNPCRPQGDKVGAISPGVTHELRTFGLRTKTSDPARHHSGCSCFDGAS
jgi:hypothetical protein